MMKHKIAFIFAGALLVLAAFMKFAMIGYGFMALIFAALATSLVIFVLLPSAARLAMAVVMVLFMVLFCYWELQIVKASRTIPQNGADYMIVLGCGVRGTTPSVAMRNRTDAAAQYLKDNPYTLCIVSGGQGPGEDITEALAMKNLITAEGISPDRIIMEECSTSTDENLRYSAEIIEENGGSINDSAIVICSSEYHIFRARHLSEELFGVPFDGLPARSTLPVSRINYFLREAAGMIVISSSIK